MAGQRASTAINSAESDPSLLAEALYERARALHAQQGVPEGYSFHAYLQAAEKDK